MKVLICLLVCVAVVFAATQVTGTFYDAAGNLANGSLVIINQRFTTTTGRTIPPGMIQAAVKKGAFAKPLLLEPTDTATPAGILYTVQYALGFASFIEYWSIPTSTDPVDIACGTTTTDSMGRTVKTLASCSTTLHWSTLTPAQWAAMTPSQWAALLP